MDLNKVLGCTLGKHSHDYGVGNDFLNRAQESLTIKKKIDELDYVRIKHLCSSKEIFKRQATEWEKFFAGYVQSARILYERAPKKEDIRKKNGHKI